jgi:hypothetical protein
MIDSLNTRILSYILRKSDVSASAYIQIGQALIVPNSRLSIRDAIKEALEDDIALKRVSRRRRAKTLRERRKSKQAELSANQTIRQGASKINGDDIDQRFL